MKVTPNLIMLAVVGISGSILFAAESGKSSRPPEEIQPPVKSVAASEPKDVKDEPGTAAKAEAQQPAPEQKTAAQPAQQEDEEDAKPAAASNSKSAADSGRPSPQRFVPSEEVRPDFDVSFPVDI